MKACATLVYYEKMSVNKKQSISSEKVGTAMNLSEKTTIALKEKKKLDIDKLLDEHNDNMRLYNFFGDKAYKTKATRALNKIKKYQEGN
ncbi:hypothetical protein D3C71_1750570 [compost metagenome]